MGRSLRSERRLSARHAVELMFDAVRRLVHEAIQAAIPRQPRRALQLR